jgi:hypothetical protein
MLIDYFFLRERERGVRERGKVKYSNRHANWLFFLRERERGARVIFLS